MNNKEFNKFHHNLEVGIGQFKHKLNRLSSVERYLLGFILDFGPVKTPYINKMFSNKKQASSCKISIAAIITILSTIAYFGDPLIAIVGMIVFAGLTVFSLYKITQQIHYDFTQQDLFSQIIYAVDRGHYTNPHLKNVKEDGAIENWPRGQGIFLEAAFDVRKSIIKNIKDQ